MVWFLLPAFVGGAATSWWVTKETVTDAVEAAQPNGPLVNVGNQTNVDSKTVTVVVLALIVLWLVMKKGKR
jgi:hypothetical protein